MYIGNLETLSSAGAAGGPNTTVWVDQFPSKDEMVSTRDAGDNYLVFVTHSHWDHTRGMRTAVATDPGRCRIVCSPLCRKALEAMYPTLLSGPGRGAFYDHDDVFEASCLCRRDPLELQVLRIRGRVGGASESSPDLRAVAFRAFHMRGAWSFYFPQFETVYLGESRFHQPSVSRNAACLQSKALWNYWRSEKLAAPRNPSPPSRLKVVLDGMFGRDKDSPSFPRVGDCERQSAQFFFPSGGSRFAADDAAGSRRLTIFTTYHTGGMEYLHGLASEVNARRSSAREPLFRILVWERLVYPKFWLEAKALYGGGGENGDDKEDQQSPFLFLEDDEGGKGREELARMVCSESTSSPSGELTMVANPRLLKGCWKRNKREKGRQTKAPQKKKKRSFFSMCRICNVSSMWSACKNNTGAAGGTVPSVDGQLFPSIFQKIGSGVAGSSGRKKTAAASTGGNDGLNVASLEIPTVSFKTAVVLLRLREGRNDAAVVEYQVHCSQHPDREDNRLWVEFLAGGEGALASSEKKPQLLFIEVNKSKKNLNCVSGKKLKKK